jgi:hypothetical protein
LQCSLPRISQGASERATDDGRRLSGLQLEADDADHADFKRTARVRAFFDVVGDGLAAERALFPGPRAGPANDLRATGASIGTPQWPRCSAVATLTLLQKA